MSTDTATYSLIRDEQGNVLLPNTRLGVYVDGRRVGVVMQVAAGTWRVFDAGMGVDDDQPRLVFDTPQQAAERVLALRADSPATAVVDGLTGVERRMLDVEGQGFVGPAKYRAIAREFGVTETRYYQVLLALLDRPEALVYSPVTVNRLRRIRDDRQARRRLLRAV